MGKEKKKRGRLNKTTCYKLHNNCAGCVRPAVNGPDLQMFLFPAPERCTLHHRQTVPGGPGLHHLTVPEVFRSTTVCQLFFSPPARTRTRTHVSARAQADKAELEPMQLFHHFFQFRTLPRCGVSLSSGVSVAAPQVATARLEGAFRLHRLTLQLLSEAADALWSHAL